MKLFVARNIHEKPSKFNDIVYLYITKKGIPIAFEIGSLFWESELIGDYGRNALEYNGEMDVLVSAGSYGPRQPDKIIKKGSQMGFTLQPVQGTVQELATDLAELPKHEREEKVITVVKECIDDIVQALGGYLSVSCNGNINPVPGENGDLVNIYITSLSAPSSATPVPTIPPAEVVPTEAPVNTENTGAPVAETNPSTPAGSAPKENETVPIETTTPPAEFPPSEDTPVSVEAPVATPPTEPVETGPVITEAPAELPLDPTSPSSPATPENPSTIPPVSPVAAPAESAPVVSSPIDTPEHIEGTVEITPEG